jgi:hypothetical protein
MKNSFLIMLLLDAIISLPSCQKTKKGCREVKTDGPNFPPYSLRYYCSVETDPVGPFGVLQGTSQGAGQNTFEYVIYEDESCASLGYKAANKSDYAGMFVNESGDNTPGENSFWASDPSDPNTPAFCTGYVSPCTDPQVNPFCETAYNYRCMYGLPATDVHVTEPCGTYNGFRELNPAILPCDYCN